MLKLAWNLYSKISPWALTLLLYIGEGMPKWGLFSPFWEGYKNERLLHPGGVRVLRV